jgi:hypothetical protein
VAHLIRGDTIPHAWLSALEHLIGRGGKDVNLAVAIASPIEEPPIRKVLDSFLLERRRRNPRRGEVFSVNTVANTLFPEALYRPELGPGARERLFALHEEATTVHKRLRQPKTYFDRLVAWPSPRGSINQLERTVGRLQQQLGLRGPLGSVYELAVATPNDARRAPAESTEQAAGADDLRVYTPGLDNGLRGFPCLSHISLTLVQGRLHMTAIYRNQHFIRRAYGNYVGLARLMRFFTQEAECEPGEILCVASHADAERGQGAGFGLHDLQQLVSDCQKASESVRADRIYSGV